MFDRLKSIFSAKDEPAIVVSSVDEHNAVYKRGCELVKGRLFLDAKFPRLSASEAAEMRTAVRCFQAVVTFHPMNWNAHWLLGKAHQVLKNDLAAYASFKRAYEINQDNPNVPRELAEICLKLGHGPEAVTACHSAIELSPNDAGLHGNLALAYFISGELNFAKRAIQYALELDPNDKINERVRNAIDEVVDGRRVQPKNLRDLQPNS